MPARGLSPTLWPVRIELDPPPEVEIEEVRPLQRTSTVAHCQCEDHPGQPCAVTIDAAVPR